MQTLIVICIIRLVFGGREKNRIYKETAFGGEKILSYIFQNLHKKFDNPFCNYPLQKKYRRSSSILETS